MIGVLPLREVRFVREWMDGWEGARYPLVVCEYVKIGRAHV